MLRKLGIINGLDSLLESHNNFKGVPLQFESDLFRKKLVVNPEVLFFFTLLKVFDKVNEL